MTNLSFIPVNELNNYNGYTKLSTGDDSIDDYLGGGIPCGCITQIIGKSSAGKSQFCMQLGAKLRSINDMSNCVYISRDKLSFYPERFITIYRGLGGTLSEDDLLSNIYVSFPTTSDMLQQLLQKILTWSDLKLLCIEDIDSISSDYTGQKWKVFLRHVAVRLHQIAEKFNAAIIVNNQVVNKWNNKFKSIEEVSSLGINWSMYCTYKLWFNVSDVIIEDYTYDFKKKTRLKQRNIVLKKWFVKDPIAPLFFEIQLGGIKFVDIAEPKNEQVVTKRSKYSI